MVFFIKRKRLHRSNKQDRHKAPVPLNRKKCLLLLLLFILLASILFLFSRLMNTRRTVIQQQQVLLSVQEPPDASSEISGKWYGLCAKESIHSIADFQNTLANDSLLAEHFADFDWKSARMGKLEKAVWTHIAYRHNNRIATTRRVIRLPAGDGYITDGKRWLRTYCCNDYVIAAPPGPAAYAPLVLPVEAADSPERLVTAAATDPDKELDQLVKSIVENDVTGPDRPKPRIPAITVVPEPAPLLLLGSGIVFLLLLARRQRRLSGEG